MSKTARDVMTGGAECIGENESIRDAAKRMAQLDVGALPICGTDNRLKGMLTDRDIAIKVVAEGRDPDATSVREVATSNLITVDPEDDLDEAMRLMARHQVRRLAVVEGSRLVGVVAQADVARDAKAKQTGEVVEEISQ